MLAALLFQLVFSQPPDLLKPPPDHTRLLRAGSGKVHPQEGDFVKLHYIEWNTADGKVITKANNQRAAIVDTNEMSEEWRNDILKMVVGEETYVLSVGDSLTFAADQNHVYENPGSSEARYHNGIVYRR